jgi:hypothetical protein
LGASLADQTPLLEAAQNAAQVASVQSQLLTEFARRRLIAVSKLVEDAYLSQREWTLQIPVSQHADPPRPEPVEAPDFFYAPVEIFVCHRLITNPHTHKHMLLSVNYLIMSRDLHSVARDVGMDLEAVYRRWEAPLTPAPPPFDSRVFDDVSLLSVKTMKYT